MCPHITPHGTPSMAVAPCMHELSLNLAHIQVQQVGFHKSTDFILLCLIETVNNEFLSLQTHFCPKCCQVKNDKFKATETGLV